jgi:hypothetical protein
MVAAAVTKSIPVHFCGAPGLKIETWGTQILEMITKYPGLGTVDPAYKY